MLRKISYCVLDPRKIFMTHYPMLAKPMAKSGDFDVVFYGHDHKKNIDKYNNCIIVNPGEVSAHKTKKSTFSIYDTEKNEAEIIELKNTISVKSELVEKYMKNVRIKFSKTKSHQY